MADKCAYNLPTGAYCQHSSLFMKRTILLLSAVVGFILTSCYYHKEDLLYGSSCDTTNVTYAATITSLLNNYGCLGCHVGANPSGGINRGHPADHQRRWRHGNRDGDDIRRAAHCLVQVVERGLIDAAILIDDDQQRTIEARAEALGEQIVGPARVHRFRVVAGVRRANARAKHR